MRFDPQAGKLYIQDVTLRDGMHAIRHKYTIEHVSNIARALDEAGVSAIEVAHGDGLNGSSFNYGFGAHTDWDWIEAAGRVIKKARLTTLLLPGIGTVEDLRRAHDLGVTSVRIATHCTEANVSRQHIGYARKVGMDVSGFLMMSHMASPIEFLEEAKLMEGAGAEALILMDSAGALSPSEIKGRIEILHAELGIPTGIHAHNNLGYATTNTIVAVEAGARIIDACIAGFGAGAGNAQIELVLPLLYDSNFIEFEGLEYFEVADKALESFAIAPVNNSLTIATGRAGIFSGYLKPIQRAANEFKVSPFQLINELGKRKIVAGQEDVVLEVAQFLTQSE
jgi:4-hydroxy 2-oxovalerate aldolase